MGLSKIANKQLSFLKLFTNVENDLASFLTSQFPATSLKYNSKEWMAYKVIRDFGVKMLAAGLNVYVYTNRCDTALKVGLITSGSVALSYDKYVFIAAKPHFISALDRVIAGCAVRSDVRLVREYIYTYNLGYKREVLISDKICKMPFLLFSAPGVAQCENITVCEPFPVYTSPDLIVYRSSDGYQCFGSNLDVARQFVREVPIIPIKRIEFNSEGVIVNNPAVFISELKKNVELLRDVGVYKKLVWLMSQRYDISTVKGLLNLSHYMLYDERNSTRCVVLSGPSGVGKSTAVLDLVKGKSVFHVRYDPKNKMFYDGYYGQDIIVIDDLGHYSREEWLPLIKWLSPCPSVMPMANVNNIGSIPMVSSLILITTNCLKKLMTLDKDTKNALGRRIDLIDVQYDSVTLKLYKPSLQLFVDVQKLERENLAAYLTSYVEEIEVSFSVTCVGKILQCVGKILEFNPFNQVVNKIFDAMRDVYTLVGRILYATRGNGCVGKYSTQWIPRSLRSMFFRLTKDMQTVVVRKLLHFYSVVGGEMLCDVKSMSEFMAEGRSSDHIFDYDMRRVPPMVGKPCMGSETPSFDLRANISYTDNVDASKVMPVIDDRISEVGYTTYTISGLSGEMENWIKPGVVVKPIYMRRGELMYAAARLPLADKLFRVRDQSEWKANFPSEKTLDKDWLNILLHPSSGVSKTVRRRMQRQRQKQRRSV